MHMIYIYCSDNDNIQYYKAYYMNVYLPTI